MINSACVTARLRFIFLLHALMVFQLAGLLAGCGPTANEQRLGILSNHLVTERNQLQMQLELTRHDLEASKKALSTNQPAIAALQSQLADAQQKLRRLAVPQPAEAVTLSSQPARQDQSQSHQTVDDSALLRIQLADLTAQSQHTASEQQSLQRKLENSDVAVEELHRNIQQLTSDKISAENDAKILREDAVSASTELAALKTENNSLKDGNNAMASALASAKDSNATLTKENNFVTSRLAQLEGNTQSLNSQARSLNQQLELTAGQLDSAQVYAAKLNADYEGLLKEKSALASSNEAVRTALDTAKHNLDSAQSQVAELSGARGIYTVQKIDSLSTIAAFFYRNGNQWGKILEANSFMVNDPDRIYPGMVLIIPQ